MNFWDVLLAKKVGHSGDFYSDLMAKALGGEPKPVPEWLTVSGTSPLSLPNAVVSPLQSLTQFGKSSQESAPSPANPVPIKCNNGSLKIRRPSGMPIRYQMVEWLCSTKGIATDLYTTKETEVRSRVYRPIGNAQYIYCSDSNSSGSTNTTAYMSNNGATANWRFGNRVLSIGIPIQEYVETKQNKEGVWVDGDKKGSYTSMSDFTSTDYLRIHGTANNADVQIYWIKVLEQGLMVGDFVPVHDLVTDTYGWYNKVSGFYSTNDEATITYGSDVPDAIEVYTDGTPEIIAVGTNHYNSKSSPIVQGNVRYNGGDLTSSTAVRTDGYIPVNPLTKYIVRFKGTVETASGCIYEYSNDSGTDYEADFNWTSYIFSQSGCVITTGRTTKGLRIAFYNNGSMSPTYPEDIQEVTVVNAEQTASVENLWDLSDNHSSSGTVPIWWDTQDIISGAVVRNCGIKIVDGTENWQYGAQGAGYYWLDVYQDTTVMTSIGVRCTHYPTGSVQQNNDPLGYRCFWDGYSRFYINVVASYADLDAFKAFLREQWGKGTPMIFLYPLRESVIESVTAQALETENGDNTMTVTAEVSGIEFEAIYKGYAEEVSP